MPPDRCGVSLGEEGKWVADPSGPDVSNCWPFVLSFDEMNLSSSRDSRPRPRLLMAAPFFYFSSDDSSSGYERGSCNPQAVLHFGNFVYFFFDYW